MKKIFKLNDIQFIKIDGDDIVIVFRDGDDNYAWFDKGSFVKIQKEFNGKRKSIEEIILTLSNK